MPLPKSFGISGVGSSNAVLSGARSPRELPLGEPLSSGLLMLPSGEYLFKQIKNKVTGEEKIKEKHRSCSRKEIYARVNRHKNNIRMIKEDCEKLT
ncbi:hypothetical protein RAX52_002091 [Vibrio parahaemolyticus]|nr:hypothetical protein [Vibrio parahaemolyticus]